MKIDCSQRRGNNSVSLIPRGSMLRVWHSALTHSLYRLLSATNQHTTYNYSRGLLMLYVAVASLCQTPSGGMWGNPPGDPPANHYDSCPTLGGFICIFLKWGRHAQFCSVSCFPSWGICGGAAINLKLQSIHWPFALWTNVKLSLSFPLLCKKM